MVVYTYISLSILSAIEKMVFLHFTIKKFDKDQKQLELNALLSH